MCGIAGFFRFDGKLNQINDIEHMVDAMEHRGPDDIGYCGLLVTDCMCRTYPAHAIKDIGDNVNGVLGFRRLSIQDLSSNGHQPMLSTDGMVALTFNGEIYNANFYRDLLKSEGFVFKGDSDTEVILNMYLKYGFENCVKRLNGMYSIVLFDGRLKQLFIARDRLGIIPLYFYRNENMVAWGSELKCFRNVSFYNPKISTVDISELMLYCFPSVTGYDEIDVVEPGTIMTVNVEDGSTKIEKYYDINNYKTHNRPYDQAIEETESVLRNVVNRQLVSDRPLGVQFSGGVDSTLIAAYAADEYAKRGQKLNGFSLINSQAKEYDESPYIFNAASKVPIQMNTIDMTVDRFVNDLEICTFALERPLNDPSPLGIYEFSRMAKENVTVLLSGEGADELCGGYADFGRWLESDINLDSDAFIRQFNCQISESLCQKILNEFKCDAAFAKRKDQWKGVDGTSFSRIRKMYFYSLLRGLLERQNKMCMINSIENRVPFLDNDFVDLMMEMPDEYLARFKGDNYVGKYLLKDLNSKIYGENFAFRKKQFIRVPIMDYLRNRRFRDYVKRQICPTMEQRGIVNMTEFKEMYDHMDINNVMVIWKAINIELWFQLFIDGRMPTTIN